MQKNINVVLSGRGSQNRRGANIQPFSSVGGCTTYLERTVGDIQEELQSRGDISVGPEVWQWSAGHESLNIFRPLECLRICAGSMTNVIICNNYFNWNHSKYILGIGSPEGAEGTGSFHMRAWDLLQGRSESLSGSWLFLNSFSLK